MKNFAIQIPVTFQQLLPNIGIEFSDIPENYNKLVSIRIEENKKDKQKTRSWEYNHIIQETNLVEFTSLEYGKYSVSIIPVNNETIDNPFTIKTFNRSLEYQFINSNTKINIDLLDKSEINDRRRGRGDKRGAITTRGSFFVSANMEGEGGNLFLKPITATGSSSLTTSVGDD